MKRVGIVSDDLNTTSVYQYDTANEQTKMTTDGTDMTFTYDDWGRMITRAISDHAATFSYRSDKLAWMCCRAIRDICS